MYEERDRERAERRYVAALVALDAASAPSTVVQASAAAASSDLERLNRIWNGDAPAPRSRFGRLLTEINRLMPWTRRRALGSLIAVANRNAEATRALIESTQHFHSNVIWYAQTVAALAAAPRKTDLSAPEIARLQEAFDAMQTYWLQQVEALAAREQRFEARLAALAAIERRAAASDSSSTLPLQAGDRPGTREE